MTDRETYVGLFETIDHAIEFEIAVLSIGGEFLPLEAQHVRDGGKPTPEYWEWLCDQANQARQEQAMQRSFENEATEEFHGVEPELEPEPIDYDDQIEPLAAECASKAREQGAVGPWQGDLLPGDLEALKCLLGTEPTEVQLQRFDRAFRQAIGHD